jgi:ribulose-bisphosphate carboxylase large chain|tara:strand:- start:1547 stop:2821 length:1275 start_codon:yes stop_codon:yes gene_type:complete
MLKYINLRYKPIKEDLICEYYLEPNRISFEKTCEHIAGESSIGTWTTISTMNPKIARKLKPKVYSINKRSGTIKIAYPVELFEPGNMPQILSSIAGNIFGMKAVKNLRLEDIHFPKKLVNSFKGPKFGIKGLRKLSRIKDRPLVGTIVKPKVGLTASQHAKVAYEAWVGGLDTVKEDENLGSMKFNNFYDRFLKTMKMKNKAEKETGEVKFYMPNITSETDEMIKRGEFVKKHGGNYLMVDILTTGWAGFQTVRKHEFNLPLHCHRAMHAAITKNPKHGISMLTIAKITRLIGGDTLHIGTAAIGKMIGSKQDELAIEHDIENQYIHENDKLHMLSQKWYNIKPTMAVASGGLQPGMIPKLVDTMGKDVVYQFGGGVHGNSFGTRAGAKAVRQALDAALQGISLREYSKSHKELKQAVAQWGVK